MRIISGRWKGKRLTAPKNLPTRPTTDFAKEALFNILNHRFYLNEVEVLDLFAGIGSISYEFASRGAEKVHSVEIFEKCARYIQETAEALAFDKVEVFKQDVFKFLDKSFHQKYDIVFADPPFDMDIKLYKELIDHVMDKEFLDDGGIFILEHPKNQSFDTHPHFLEFKKYGNIYFSFFELEDVENDEEE